MDDPVSKYRALLQGIEEQQQKKKFRDVEMEVSWGVGLKDKTEELVQKKLKERKGDLTPFEQYLQKRKEKKKQKKEVKKNNIQQVTIVVLMDIFVFIGILFTIMQLTLFHAIVDWKKTVLCLGMWHLLCLATCFGVYKHLFFSNSAAAVWLFLL